MKYFPTLFVLLFSFSIYFSSCSKSSTATPTAACTGNLNFNDHIKRILDVNCNACHAPNSGYSLALSHWTYDGSYQNVFSRRNDINGQVAAGLMPQGRPLPQVVRDSINCWVASGAAN